VSVCITHDMKQRIKLLARFIELADECRQLGCYNTVFAMVAGLSNSLITRLKKTWAVRPAVAAWRHSIVVSRHQCSRPGLVRCWRCDGPQSLPKKTAAIWTDLENLCSPQINYRAYRAIEAEAKPPFIPFIGMHLRDMVFMNDGNPSELPNGLIKYGRLAPGGLTRAGAYSSLRMHRGRRCAIGQRAQAAGNGAPQSGHHRVPAPDHVPDPGGRKIRSVRGAAGMGELRRGRGRSSAARLTINCVRDVRFAASSPTLMPSKRSKWSATSTCTRYRSSANPWRPKRAPSPSSSPTASLLSS